MSSPDPDVLPLPPGSLLRSTPRPEGDVDGFVLEDAAEPARHPAGGDANAPGAWTERHILGTRTGTNRNGRKR